jgi:hypothetical protein
MVLFKLKKSKGISVEGNDQDTPTKGETVPEYHEEHKRGKRKSIHLKYGYLVTKNNKQYSGYTENGDYCVTYHSNYLFMYKNLSIRHEQCLFL